MKRIIITVIITIVVLFTTIVTPSFASVEGINANNYDSYVKPNADAYGFNKGECEKKYLAGEEYFYNEYYDHWNVDKIYDSSKLPQSKTKYNNLKVAKKWTKKHYKKYTIKVVNYGKVPKKRKSSKIIYIEKIPTTSDGGYDGHDCKGYYVRYSKKVKKNVKQNCYCVWNPKNNICDDVVAFANCNTIK